MTAEQPAGEPVVDVTDLQVHFKIRRGLTGAQTVRAVDGVSFALAARSEERRVGKEC